MVMRLSMGHVDEYDERIGRFARQLGLSGIQLHSPSNLSIDKAWGREELAALVERCGRSGLTIDGLENVPLSQFWKIQQGLPGRDEQIEDFLKTLRNMGSVGIPVLGYNFQATFVWRTEMYAEGRGGANVTAFDLDDALTHGNALAGYKLVPGRLDEGLDAERMWQNHQYFLDAALPVAEEVGVRLALHPDDPPVEECLGGAARIFTTPTALTQARGQARHSPAWGVNLCVGTVSERGGEAAVLEAIDALAPQGSIISVHFRDVLGIVPHFREAFLGEGNFNPATIVRRLAETGFDGFVIDDHVPAMEGDVGTWGDTSPLAYCSRARAHAIGYLQGVFNTLGLH